MTRASRSMLTLLALLVFLVAPGTAGGTVTDPFSFFNVFSRGAIGRSADLYDGEIRGIVGAAGSCWFKNNSINVLELGPSSIACFAGGDVEMISVLHYGSIEAAGRVLLRSVELDGGISSGLSVWGHGATIAGDAAAAGTIFLESCSITGAVMEEAGFAPSVDLESVAAFFLGKSLQYGAWGGDAPQIAGSQIEFAAGAGVNIFDVAAADLGGAESIVISGPGSAWVIINVRGTSAEIVAADWQLDPRIPVDRVLINFPEAAVLEVGQMTILGNLLAPRAATHFFGGLIVGGLWVGDLQGGGHVDWGFFTEPDLPTPNAQMTWGRLKSLFE